VRDASTAKVLDRERLAAALEERRVRGEKVVFTNGCFDILHVGHARYLAEARALGDLLVVGLNSDHSVQALKGPGRPLVPQEERAEMLAHLASVDYVCIFPEATPVSLIEAVRPAVHVKGGDYQLDDLPEAEAVRRGGGEVVIVSLVPGRSTTNIVSRILEAYADPPTP
jgi:D-glycero-beta-D-manno-heptose 1-phosphate adenylyltransferase